MMWNSTSFLAGLEEQIGKKFDVRVAFLPKNKQMGTDLGGTGLGIFKSNPEQEKAAWEFVNWMTSPKWAAYWSENTGYVVTDRASRELKSHQEFLKANPQYDVAAKQMPHAGIMPASKADSITYKQFSKLAEKLEAEAGVDVQKELDQMAKEVKEKVK
jgi:sn-glycerol 3-phosphate transport system substrate-binding protein